MIDLVAVCRHEDVVALVIAARVILRLHIHQQRVVHEAHLGEELDVVPNDLAHLPRRLDGQGDNSTLSCELSLA